MVTVKSSQKIFTDSEVASLTGICVEHIRKFAKTRHLGFRSRRRSRRQCRQLALHLVRSHGFGDFVPQVQSLNSCTRPRQRTGLL